ncbi:MAG: hypothetical protein HYZ42_10725 [Bacteroidetes bacterium]|nr:hypothetical protein [Bacteroidota bacterium]
MSKKIIYLIVSFVIVYSCQSKDAKEPEEPTVVEKVQADSMVKNDQQKADSMMKALKEKLK